MKQRPKGASRLSSEALAQPGEGEVFLVYHPVPRGWVGIALSPDFGAIAKALPELDPKAEPHELAVQILDPFRERIDGARRIRFLAYGALDQRDLHALPLMPAGRPLLEIAPVEYGVDLPGRGTKPHGPARLGALVVSNPTGNLPRAHQEGQVATTVLRHTLSRRVELLEGSAATTRSIQASLQDPEIDFLHFAGHGHAPKGDEESTLSLAGGGSISASDILMLPRCPRVVVLSGCETARPSRAAVAEGLGLAQAFVVAGAGTAVAAIQPVG
jgi:CHAT domain-containing protein